MYKLTVISGPNVGTTYVVQEGEMTIGRQAGNAIVLPSSKVSKLHFTITSIGEDVVLKDQDSSNGTFVNGSLTKHRKIGVGDRISVGEYVLELSNQVQKSLKPIALPNKMRGQFQIPQDLGPGPIDFANPPGVSGASDVGGGIDLHSPTGPPKDLRGKLLWAFERQLMPVFYSFNFKYEWRGIMIVIFLAFALLNLAVSVYPLLEASHQSVIKEMGKRAQFMARQIAEQNALYLANRMETKTDIGIIATAEGVRTAMLVDMTNRIIAPSAKLNLYLTSGVEALTAVKARDRFAAGKETGYWVEGDDSTLVAIEPVKILSPSLGKNIVVAMAVVSIDSGLATPELGELGVIYSEILAITGAILGVILLIFYRVTLKPFQVLNEDIDRALKGEISQVTHEFKIEELNSLWDIINSAILRAAKSTTSESTVDLTESAESYDGALRMLGGLVKFGFLAFDYEKKIIFINPVFEEMSGIRSDGAKGQEISAVARDQAMISMTTDMLARTSTGNEGVAEDFDFAGVPCKVYVAGFGSLGKTPQCFIMAAVRVE